MPVSNTQFYGINKGGAQVLDNSPVMDSFQKMLAKQAQQRQLEMKQLTDEQAQLKPEGLRNDADRKDFFSGVNDWRNMYIKSMQETDPYKKSLLKSQADQKYMDLHSLVGESKQQAEAEKAFSTQLMNPAVRDRYKDETVSEFLKNKQLGVRNSGLVKDFNSYEQIADHTKAMKTLQDIDEKGKKEGVWDNGTYVTTKLPDGTTRTQTRYGQTYPEEKRFADLTKTFTMDRDVKKTLMDINPDIWNNPNLTYDQKRDASIQKYMKDTGVQTRYTEPKDHYQQPDRFYAHEEWKYQNAPGNQYTPSQTLLTDMQNGVPGTGEKLISLTPKGQYGKAKDGSTKPQIGIVPGTGEHRFDFPPVIDPKAKEYNDGLRAQFKKLYPNDPYNQSIPGYKLKEEVKTPQKTYIISPQSPDYVAKVAEMAKEQNIDLGKLDKIESVKGGHGQIKEVRMAGSGTKPSDNKTYKTSKGGAYTHAELLKMGYSEAKIQEYLKAGLLK